MLAYRNLETHTGHNLMKSYLHIHEILFTVASVLIVTKVSRARLWGRWDIAESCTLEETQSTPVVDSFRKLTLDIKMRYLADLTTTNSVMCE
jgi:hypothetical protein